MKKVTLIMLFFVVGLSLPAFASPVENPPLGKDKLLRNEIMNLVGKEVPFKINKNDEVLSRVSFLLNEANELIVISVLSDDPKIKSFLEGRLDNRKLKVKGIQRGKIYNVKFRFLPS